MALLSTDLIRKLRTRAANPDTRTDAPPSTRGKTVSFAGFGVVGLRLDGSHLEQQPPVEPAPLNPPAASETVAAVEARFGCSLPPDLRQLHMEIADGGFGPGSGLAPINKIADRYLNLVAHPPGERGQTWPADLLPFTLTGPGADCYNRQTSEITLWDEESLADGPSDKVWNRSFKKGCAQPERMARALARRPYTR